MTVHCLSRFHLLRPLGSGTPARVFQAEDLRLGSHVAVKILPSPLCHDLRWLEHLKHGAEVIAGLQHPHICAINEVDEDEGQHFVVMELLEGKSLSDALGGQPASAGLLLKVGMKVADALDAAHAAGIVHGNLKPAKIFLTSRGEVRVLDFCVASVHGVPDWRAHAPMETMAYASPEELLGLPIDGRADIFSLGVILYEMATGQKPFGGQTAKALVNDILHHSPTRAARVGPALHPGIDWTIHRCLEKRPELRYQSAGQLRDDLQRTGLVPEDREAESRTLS
jgi:serine/threonine protein kinase